MALKINKWVLFFFLVFLLLGCGGGGDDSPGSIGDGDGPTNTSLNYSGETKQATLSGENVDELANAAASGAKQAISSDSVPVVGQRAQYPVSREQVTDELAVLIGGVLRDSGDRYAGRGVSAARTEDLSSSFCDSGSLIVDYPDTGISGDWRIVFSQCDRTTRYGTDSYSATFHGEVEGTYTRVGIGYRLTFRYLNFSVAINNPSGSYSDTFNMSVTCTASDEQGTDLSCEYYSDYLGYDNRTYRVTEVSVSGSGASGYSVSVRVYDPDHGYVTVTTEVPVAFGCSGGRPSAGRVRMEAANFVVATVEFISCSQYVVTFEGVARTFNWP